MGAKVTFSHEDIDPKSIQPVSFSHDDIDPNSISGGYDLAGSAGRILRAASTGARSALETGTLGLSEPVLSGAGAVANTLTDAYQGKGKISLDDLEKNYQASVEARRREKGSMPVADMLGSIGGALVPGTPAAKVVGKVGGLIGGAAESALPEVEAGGGKIVQGLKNLYGNTANVATGALQGAGTGLALEVPRQIFEGTTGFIKKGDKNVPNLDDVAKYGGLIGGGVPAAGIVAKGVGDMAGGAGKKLMSAFLGPSDEHINYYLKNPKAVNEAPSIQVLKEKVDGITDSLREDVEKGAKSVDEAKKDFRDVEKAIVEHKRQSDFEYGVTSTQVKQQLRDSKKSLEDAFEKQTRALKGVKAPTDLADEVTSAVGDLKGQVIEGSKAAREHLTGDQSVDMFSPYKTLKGFRDSLNVAGKAPDPFTARTQASIDSLIEHVSSLPSKISEKEAKELLLRLDRSEQASKAYSAQAQGGFTDDVALAYKKLREAVNEQLVTGNSKYNEAMEPVRKAAALHSDVSGLGDRAKALSALNRVASPTGAVDREGLLRLGEATGRDFDQPINRYIEAQNTLKNPDAMDKIRQGLPEYPQMLEAEKAARMLEGPEAKAEYAQGKLNQSGLLSRREAAQGLLTEQQKVLLEAENKLQPFKGISPANSQQKLETAGTKLRGEDRIELQRTLGELSKLSDVDFNKEVKNLRTQKAFQGTDINGSRKVNLFGAVAGGIFGGIGHIAGHGLMGTSESVAIGAVIGGMADKYGPSMTKRILDGYLKIQGSPTLAKIQALDVPPQVKAYLAKELADFNNGDQK